MSFGYQSGIIWYHLDVFLGYFGCHLEVNWWSFGGQLVFIWVSFRIIWVTFGSHVGVMWGSVGGDLEVIWGSFGCHLGAIWDSCYTILGSRDASTLQHISSLEAVFGGSQGYDLSF